MMKLLLILYKLRIIPTKLYAKIIGVNFGNDCCFFHCDFPSEPYLLKIGDNVQITSGVKFFTHSGGWIFRKMDPTFDTFGKISVGNNVYIGNNSLILPGVIIGNNVYIGAGSVVTKSIPNNVVVAGNPAKIISSIESFYIKYKKYDLKTATTKNKRKIILNADVNYFILKDLAYVQKNTNN